MKKSVRFLSKKSSEYLRRVKSLPLGTRYSLLKKSFL